MCACTPRMDHERWQTTFTHAVRQHNRKALLRGPGHRHLCSCPDAGDFDRIDAVKPAARTFASGIEVIARNGAPASSDGKKCRRDSVHWTRFPHVTSAAPHSQSGILSRNPNPSPNPNPNPHPNPSPLPTPYMNLLGGDHDAVSAQTDAFNCSSSRLCRCPSVSCALAT